MTWLAAACVLAAIPAGLRLLRIAQREHYLPGEVTRFAVRWWRGTGVVNGVIDAIAMVGVVISPMVPEAGFAVAVAQVGPIGLSVRGTTSPLAWTGRLRRLALVSAVLTLASMWLGVSIGQAWLVVLPLFLLYTIIDLALWLLDPYETRAGGRWVDKAAARLGAIGAEVVAITGSYGKTTTKNYVAHLLTGARRVVASPASFNNRMGLARAINEYLTPGTEIFIAEMGTYGPGEIAELCEWIPPKVSAMVAIGPVHLERFKTIESIVEAKAEILDRAEVGVICVDQPMLARLAEERSQTMRIIPVSAADGIEVDGHKVMDVPGGVFGTNLAVALGICRALGVDLDLVMGRVSTLPTPDHRQSVSQAAGGFTIIDDTFNSNPAGAASALDLLLEKGAGGTTAVITPGMVELGPVQDEENRVFADLAASLVDHLIIVGRTNRAALLRGSANGEASVTVVDSRGEAVDWVRATLGPGDAVLYENDLPDHYP
ncbi:MAG TPA: Mur ligase family protein [Acidimicrobiia bacterium]|nr:Mur ligase family protein [Acidimicrobiia bacterium]